MTTNTYNHYQFLLWEHVNIFWSLLSIHEKLLEHHKTTPPAASGYTLVTALPASQESGGDR